MEFQKLSKILFGNNKFKLDLKNRLRICVAYFFQFKNLL